MSHRGLLHNNSLTGDHDRDLTPSRISHCSDDSTRSSSGGCGVPADSSSERSEGEFAKTPGGSRKCSPRKISKTGNVTPQPGEFGSTNRHLPVEDGAARTTRPGGRTFTRRHPQQRRVGRRELRIVRFALRLSRQDERNGILSETFDIWYRVQADSSATICQVYGFPTSPHPTGPRARRI
ncbi:hypothetical protein MRX96_000440 [Rhipicephalus microplus]